MASSLTNAQVMQSISEVGPRAMDDCISRFSDLWRLIEKKNPSNPNGPTWDAKVGANTSAEATVPGASLAAADYAEIVKAQLNWANYIPSVTINQQQMKQLELAAAGGLANYDLLLAQIEELGQSVASAVNTGLIAGSDTTKDIIGLATAIDDAGTYAGISRASYSEWACYVAHNSGSPRTLTVSIMDIAYDYFRNTVGKNPGRWVLIAGASQVSTMRGFSTGAASVYAISGPEGVSKVLSTTDVKFRDVPVLEVPGYTTGRVDFVNLDALSIECLHGAENPFLVKMVEEAASDLTYIKCYFNGQLVLRNPRHNAFSIQDLS